jgi:hypothetical protein
MSSPPPRELIGPDTPLRLKVAAEVAFPDGTMTASGLRREAAARPPSYRADRWEGLHHPQRHSRNEETMPRRSKGPRLYLQPARRDADGRLIEQAVWVIRDRDIKRSTGAGEGEIGKAEGALRNYLNHTAAPRIRDRDPAAVPIANVIAVYTEDVVAKHARPNETAARLGRILDHFGENTLGYLNRQTCEEYAKARGYMAAARRELEDLRAAIRHHWEAGLCTGITPVVLPDKSSPRQRWLTRDEAARLLWAAWRLRQCHRSVHRTGGYCRQATGPVGDSGQRG